MTDEEQRGMRAIQYLQSLAEIDESDEDATKGWNEMSSEDQRQTMLAFTGLGGTEEDLNVTA